MITRVMGTGVVAGLLAMSAPVGAAGKTSMGCPASATAATQLLARQTKQKTEIYRGDRTDYYAPAGIKFLGVEPIRIEVSYGRAAEPRGLKIVLSPGDRVAQFVPLFPKVHAADSTSRADCNGGSCRWSTKARMTGGLLSEVSMSKWISGETVLICQFDF